MRTHIIINAPTAGGKSRLGHILAEQIESLYSYTSISPDYFFTEENKLRKEFHSRPDLICKKIIKINKFLRGGSNVGRRWMGEDKLYQYDFDIFDKNMCDYINKSHSKMSLGSFYKNYDLALQKSRNDGMNSKFSVYEMEGLENYNYLNILKKDLNNLVVVSILRDPIEMIPSQKVPSLVRGSTKPDFKGGFLKRGDFDYFIYSKQIQDQYQWLMYQRKNKLNDILVLNFSELKSMNIDLAKMISNQLFKFDDLAAINIDDFALKILQSSKKKVFKNQYVYLQPHGTSYYREDWQKHLNIRITKDNKFDYMYRWEMIYPRIYVPFYEYLVRQRDRLSIYSTLINLFIIFPFLFISALIFGFKEIRINLNFKDYLKLRYNAIRFVAKAFTWCNIQYYHYYFINE